MAHSRREGESIIPMNEEADPRWRKGSIKQKRTYLPDKIYWNIQA